MAQSTPPRGATHDIKEKATDQFEKLADRATDQFKNVADKGEVLNGGEAPLCGGVR